MKVSEKLAAVLFTFGSFIILIMVMGFWTVFIFTILNLIAHVFLMRFFHWFNNDRPEPISMIEKGWFKNALLITPLALILAVFLIIVGIMLNMFKKKK